jgi:hypothetical protein
MDGETLLFHVHFIGTGLPYPALGTDEIFRHPQLSPLILFVAPRAGAVRLYRASAEESNLH